MPELNVVDAMNMKTINIQGLRGVGSVEIAVEDEQQAYVFIGENGIGKTKILEAVFQVLLCYQQEVLKKSRVSKNMLVFDNADIFGYPLHNSWELYSNSDWVSLQQVLNHQPTKHQSIINTLPTIFLGSQNRGFITNTKHSTQKLLGNFAQRKKAYLSYVFEAMNNNNFANLNMNTDIHDWFITRAQSSNPYQSEKDKRDTEIQTVIRLLHEVDATIDAKYLTIDGDGNVFLKINNEKRSLNHLSSGFASILKIIQSVVAGYAYFTNEKNLQNVKGIVLIDEIESHLHLSWTANIIPLLKKLFPNTTWLVSTHSPLVLAQLNEGEAYKLERVQDGVVRSKLINSPSNLALIDLLDDAFGVDINEIRLKMPQTKQQEASQKALLDMLTQQVERAI
jgi:predicted ATP-binding protein involved in virulence